MRCLMGQRNAYARLMFLPTYMVGRNIYAGQQKLYNYLYKIDEKNLRKDVKHQ